MSTKEYFWVDKTGTGLSATFHLADLQIDDSDKEEENENGETLLSWAENCEVGDEFETNTERYTRIK